jgi:ACS family hexuronate transporter-like MFS transporter
MAIFGRSFWSTTVQTLAADMFPTKVVGSVVGLMGAVGLLGGVAFSLVIGALLTTHRSYVPVFAIAGILPPLFFIVIMLVARKIQMVIRVEGALLNTSSCRSMHRENLDEEDRSQQRYGRRIRSLFARR